MKEVSSGNSLNLLSTNQTYQKGFTLIELMIVVAIIAVLATVGVTYYRFVNADARDAKRKSDLEAITTALEVNKTPDGKYKPLVPAMFSENVFSGGASEAFDPSGYPYCISSSPNVVMLPSLSADLSGVSGWDNTAGSSSCPTNPTGWNKVAGNKPDVGTVSWIVCIRLENRGVPRALCQSNVQ